MTPAFSDKSGAKSPDLINSMHKYGAHVVLLHVSLAKLQMLSAAAVCALTHWLRGKSGKLLIVVITDIQLLSHMHCVCCLSETHINIDAG